MQPRALLGWLVFGWWVIFFCLILTLEISNKIACSLPEMTHLGHNQSCIFDASRTVGRHFGNFLPGFPRNRCFSMRSPRSTSRLVVEPPKSQSLDRWVHLNSTRWSHVSPDLALPSWPSISKSLGKKFKAHGSSLLLCCLFCFKFPLTSSSFLCCYLKISFSNSDFFILLGLSISFFLSSLSSSVSKDLWVVNNTKTSCQEGYEGRSRA